MRPQASRPPGNPSPKPFSIFLSLEENLGAIFLPESPFLFLKGLFLIHKALCVSADGSAAAGSEAIVRFHLLISRRAFL